MFLNSSKRHELAYLIVLAVSLTLTGSVFGQAKKQKLILDADTANEIDDMYAIARMLNQDKFDVLALTSCQWIHYLAEEDSVGASQRENEDLVKLLGKTNLPLPLGSKEPMGKPWGGDQPKDSPAAQFIIKSAKAASPEEKLIVVCLGASTNLASAIKMAPECAKNIDAYVLGFKYDFEKDIWNKSSFNVRRDLNSADYLFNCKDLNLHVMPSNVAKSLTFPRDETFARHEEMGALGAHLTAKWKARFGDFQNWVMWDLALVEALIHPKFATMKKLVTPPENLNRKVWVYDSIRVQSMRDDYWATVLPKKKPATSDISNEPYTDLLKRFEDYPQKCDMLVVVAHPDDEGYFSGLLTHYSLVERKKVVVVSLTSGEWGNGLPHPEREGEPVYSFDGSAYPRFSKVPADAVYPCYFREEEMARAMLTYGVRYRPVMPRFKDMSGLEPWGKPEPCLEFWGGQAKVVGYVVSQIRRFRPDVVVTLPVDGNNGNPQHCAASRATALAVDSSGKEKLFPEQLQDFKVWIPKKLYLQVSDEENKSKRYKRVHNHQWSRTVDGTKQTVRQIAARANAVHQSQEMKEEAAETTRFVLGMTRVGEDKINRDNLFENVNEKK